MRSCGDGRRWCRGCERSEYPFIVADDHVGYGSSCGVVGVGADELWRVVAVFHNAEGGEDHRYAECYDSESADGGYELVSAGGGVFGLPSVEESVEVFLLVGGQAEYDVGTMFEENAVEVVVVLAEGCKVVFKGIVAGFGEDIIPDKFGVEVVEEEAAEEAVFRIGDEVQNLPRCAGEDCGQSRVLDVYIFTVFATDIGDSLVVEGLAETVGVVAVVGAEGVCESVAFRLEHKSLAAIVIEDLIDCGG